MSEIPYYFDTPVPSYFRKHGWFKNENAFKFVTWAFSKCQNRSHKVILDNQEIILEPYEFVAGRITSSKECFLTEKQFRGQLFSWIREGTLKKGANSRANRFTTYIWVVERFIDVEGQQKVQQRANSGPTEGHKTRTIATKDIKIKTTTSQKEVVAVVHNSEIEEAAKSYKSWLDTQADVERRRKIGGYYEKITWGQDWILPLKTFHILMDKYGVKYVGEQIQYMFRSQNEFEAGKSKKGIDKPEAFLRKSCEKNWALAETKE